LIEVMNGTRPFSAVRLGECHHLKLTERPVTVTDSEIFASFTSR
jgi:hypothetical protein